MGIQEELNREIYHFAFKTNAVTMDFFKWALKRILEMQRNPKGMQTVKQLIQQGQSVQYMPVHNKSIDSFLKNAKKFGVDFSVVENGKNYTVFFKSKDVEAFNYIIKALAEEEKTKRKGQTLDNAFEKAKARQKEEKVKVKAEEKDISKTKDVLKSMDKVFEAKEGPSL